MGLVANEVKLHLLSKTVMALHRDSKITPSSVNTAIFCFLYGVPRVLGGGVISLSGIGSPSQNYKYT